ncbi:MAG: hypothetical protein FJ197_01510 [Gammaproteobacteria bacterium]|nr:hypothetical protein [Gammaproteobacteria bacterium]
MSIALARRAALIALATVLIAACGGKDEAKTEAPAPAAAPTVAPVAPPKAPEPKLPPATVLARAGTATITAGDVVAALDSMSPAERMLYANQTELRDLVERLADRSLMAAAARAAGLEQGPVMQAMLEEPPPGMTAEQMLAEVWLETELAGAAALAPNAVEDYYVANAAEFVDANGAPQPLDAVRDTIRARLEAERRQSALSDLRARLRKGGSVALDESALASFYK